MQTPYDLINFGFLALAIIVAVIVGLRHKGSEADGSTRDDLWPGGDGDLGD